MIPKHKDPEEHDTNVPDNQIALPLVITRTPGKQPEETDTSHTEEQRQG